MTDATVPKKYAEELAKTLAAGDTAAAVAATEAAIGEGVDPLVLIQQVVVPTLTDVGQKFEDLDIFLPELMAAGEAGNARCSDNHAASCSSMRGAGRATRHGVRACRYGAPGMRAGAASAAGRSTKKPRARRCASCVTANAEFTGVIAMWRRCPSR